jgi:hypothetical protein
VRGPTEAQSACQYGKVQMFQPSVGALAVCSGAIGIAGGCGAWRPESRRGFLSPFRPVDGHSVRTGALHALFSAAARRQSRPCCRRSFARPGGASAGRRRQRSTSDGRQRISPRSSLLAAGRAKARWIHHFASTISTPSGCCPCWFERPPERSQDRSAKVLRQSTCARRDGGRRKLSGPCAPGRAAIPIAALHLQDEANDRHVR